MTLNQEVLNKSYPDDYPLYFPKFFEIDPAIALEVASLKFEEWDAVKEGIEGSFGITDIRQVPKRAIHLSDLISTIYSDEFNNFASKLTGKPVEVQGIAFQKWGANDSLDRHGDGSYIATIVLYLSPYWCTSWGGILEFSYLFGTWGAVATPKFGSASFCAPNILWSHRVTAVNPIAPIPRLAAVVRYKKSEKFIKNQRNTLDISE